MNPPKFHVGQAVVCIATAWNTPDGFSEPLPKRNQVYTISSIEYEKAWQVKWWQFWKRKYFLHLVELPARLGFDSKLFAPVELLPDEELAELLAETLDPVTA